MTAIVSNRATGDSVAASDHNTLALALAGMGVANDDLGKLIAPISLGLPFALLSSVGSAQTKAVGASTTYTVPAGKFFCLRWAATGAYTITPSGVGGWSVNLGSAGGASAALPSLTDLITLGAGDAITTPASSAIVGMVLDVPTAPSTPTRIIREVTNASTYTVPAGKRFLLTRAAPSTSTTVVTLNVDGVAAVIGVAPAVTSAGAAFIPALPPLLLTTAQVLASASTTPWTIAGLEYTV